MVNINVCFGTKVQASQFSQRVLKLNMASMQTVGSGFLFTTSTSEYNGGSCEPWHGRLAGDWSRSSASRQVVAFSSSLSSNSRCWSLLRVFQCHVTFYQKPLPHSRVIFAKCMSSRTEILTGEVGEKNEVQISEFGVYRTLEEFLAFAATLVHPLDSPRIVDQPNLRAIVSIRDWNKHRRTLFCKRNGSSSLPIPKIHVTAPPLSLLASTSKP